VAGACGVELAGGCVFGTEVCGTPEPGFGVAGLDCAPATNADRTANRTTNKALRKRCIVFIDTASKLLRNPFKITGLANMVQQIWFSKIWFSEQSLGCTKQQLGWQEKL
jgi:hypothetical protein